MQLTDLKGIKTARERLFNNLDIFTAEDLLNFFPYKYIDLSEESEIENSYGLVRLFAKITDIQIKTGKRYKKYVQAAADCQGKDIIVLWFNQPYIASKLIINKKYVFWGKVNQNNNQYQLLNPKFEDFDKITSLKGIMPVYSSCEGLSQSVIKAAINDLLYKGNISSAISESLAKQHNLIDIKTAYKKLHQPKDLWEIEICSDRVAIELLFTRYLNHYLQNKNLHAKRANRYDNINASLTNFYSVLPFSLTDSQKNAIGDIINDLNSEFLMNRLLMGDVGSGKTIVAFAAMYYVVRCSGQAAFMAPTELLAKQHYQKAIDIFEKLDIKVQLVLGSQSKIQRDTALFNIKNNVCQIVIGTHSLISENIEFNNLQLAICDEQQRFGVKQRKMLAEKGDAVDLLIMTATPVPRTLNLAIFGELNISYLTEKPNDSLIKTNIVGEHKIDDMFKFICTKIAEGRQVYIVSKNIDPDKFNDNDSVTELYKQLSSGHLKGIKTAMIHGNMSSKEKDCIMEQFALGNTKVLISTTLIEVGIDIPNANIMVIYEADKFGLSQLHQLRGRVGRGKFDSYCFLIAKTYTEQGRSRLLALKEHNNGFLLAEKDLELRGAGDFLSTRQHGKQDIKRLRNLKISNQSVALALKLYKKAVNDTDFLNFYQTKYFHKSENDFKDIILN